MSIFYIDEIEEKIGYEFNDKMLLRQCFTHSSYANEHNEKDNELLEFFGDAVIQFVVTEYLYKNSAGDEGKLTVKRQGVVSKDPLLKAVRKLGLNEYVLMGKGQEKSAKNDEKFFSSIYEALVAGIYLDGGLENVKKFIFDTIIADFKDEQSDKKKRERIMLGNSKGMLQEYIQKSKTGSISYTLLSKDGPDHSPEFKVAVLLNGRCLAEGVGTSKKTAESSAAQKALILLKQQGGNQN